MQVGALQDVRAELAKLCGVLFSKVTEDLHLHLYNRGDYRCVSISILHMSFMYQIYFNFVVHISYYVSSVFCLILHSVHILLDAIVRTLGLVLCISCCSYS